jgi:ATP-dependent DNA helicase DinG
MQRYMDSFTEYSLPETILRFLSFLNKFIKNETENEHKNIFIFDTRILKKSWGKALLDSLPEGVEVLQEVPDSL